MRLALVAFLGLLLAQVPSPPAATGRIAGTVRNAETGVPLKDATVRLVPPEVPINAITDQDGKFVLDGVPAGSYSVVATLTGFAYPDPNPGTPYARGPYVNLGNGQRAEGVTVKLVPTVSISGRVLDKNGQPATSLSVLPAQKTYDANGIETVRPGGPARFGRTDENGDYRISGLLPGEYYIMAEASGVMPTYYPGFRSLREAVPVVVSSTDLGGIDFRIVSTEKYAVRFRVAGIFPMPKELNLVLQSPAGVAATGSATTVPIPADGWFSTPPLSPADYDLTIRWTDPPSEPNSPSTLAGRQKVSFTVVDRELELGTITMLPPVTVRGHVTFKSGGRFPLNILLQSTAFDSRPPSTNWWLSEENAFDISLVPEGPYTVGTSFLPEGQYLAAATYNNADVLGRKISINGTDGRLDLVFDGPPGKLSGVVVDAKNDPVDSATVVLLPPVDRRETLDNSLVARTDQTGRFTIDRVAPGEYTLLSWEIMPQYAYKNADWIKNYEARGRSPHRKKGRGVGIRPEGYSKESLSRRRPDGQARIRILAISARLATLILASGRNTAIQERCRLRPPEQKTESSVRKFKELKRGAASSAPLKGRRSHLRSR